MKHPKGKSVAKNAAAGARGTGAAHRRLPSMSLERAESLVDWGYAPAPSNTEAAHAYQRLLSLHTLGPTGELDGAFRNQHVKAFVDAALFARLGPLAAKLSRLAAIVPGRHSAARNKQLDDERAARSVQSIEGWITDHHDKVTLALARIAVSAGWVTDTSTEMRAPRGRAGSPLRDGWELVR